MKRKGLDKLYDRLTPEERFRLDVLATARGDEEDSRRLAEGCPRRSYTMRDDRFSWRWEAARELTMVMLLDLNQHLSKLRMIDDLRSVLPYGSTLARNDAYLAYSDGRKAGSHYAWKEAGMKGDPPGWEEDADLAMEEDLRAIEARVEVSANLIPELLGRLERKVAGESPSDLGGLRPLLRGRGRARAGEGIGCALRAGVGEREVARGPRRRARSGARARNR
jgi:hypothetical protein